MVGNQVSKPSASIVYDGPPMQMSPNDGAWLPVKLCLGFCVAAQYLVVPILGTIEVGTGLWDVRDEVGIVFGSNLDMDDYLLEPGQPVGAVEPAVVQ